MFFAKKGLRNKIAIICGMVLTASFVVSCSEEKKVADCVEVYYLNARANGLDSWISDVKINTMEVEDAVADLIEDMSKDVVTSKAEPAISGYVNLKSFSVKDDVVNMDFSSEYHNLGRIEEVLHRSSIVRTLTQLKKINYVSFTIDGAPLEDHYGENYGNMSADMFIYDIGNEMNTYDQYEIKLYFVNEANDKLVPVYRSVVFNNSASVERMAVEQIIAGPNNNQVYPTISPNAKVLNLSVKDGVCHIEFSKEFLEEPFEVDPQLAIYSIVNTVTEFPGVKSVEFKVEGERNFTFRNFLISGEYKRNNELIQ